MSSVADLIELRVPAFAGPSVDAITHTEAAQILGVGVTAIPKMLRSGRLTHTYPGHKRRLSRAAVEQLAATRWRPRRHSETSYWMTGPEVAALLGCTRTSVYRMARDGRLPEPLWSRGRMLFRRVQLQVIAHAHRPQDVHRFTDLVATVPTAQQIARRR